MIFRINGCSLKTPYGLDRVADTQFLVQSNLLGLLNTILEDEVVLAQVLVVELADDLDRPGLLVEHVFVSIFILRSVFNLVGKFANIQYCPWGRLRARGSRGRPTVSQRVKG